MLLSFQIVPQAKGALILMNEWGQTNSQNNVGEGNVIVHATEIVSREHGPG